MKRCSVLLLLFASLLFSEAEEQKQNILAKDLQRGQYIILPPETKKDTHKMVVLHCWNRDGAETQIEGATISGRVFIRGFFDYTDLSPAEEEELQKILQRSNLPREGYETNRTLGMVLLKPDEKLQTYVPSERFKEQIDKALNPTNSIKY